MQQDNQNNNIKLNADIDVITKKYCQKCLSKLDENSIIKDHCDRLFCSKGCRRDYYSEIANDMLDTFDYLL